MVSSAWEKRAVRAKTKEWITFAPCVELELPLVVIAGMTAEDVESIRSLPLYVEMVKVLSWFIGDVGVFKLVQVKIIVFPPLVSVTSICVDGRKVTV